MSWLLCLTGLSDFLVGLPCLKAEELSLAGEAILDGLAAKRLGVFTGDVFILSFKGLLKGLRIG